ncbi:1-Cys peroxiredoxin-like [Brevipalpus obovatus]|uniref:1-Cys peroxiredoxin-like n=1 Tax=Brevipalpus obovatus TaxID=246614 RepID=UPI003D9E80CB
MLNIGDIFPDFTVESTLGKISLYDYVGTSWAILFSHPKDFTPVCTTELGKLAQLQGEFEKRGVKVLGLSVDSVQDHQLWSRDIAEYSNTEVKYPLLADPKGEIARSLGILDKDATDTLTVRAVFIISPDRKVRATICYPTSCGRNFNEILRLVDSLQYTDQNPSIVTPAEWNKGEEAIIKPGADSVPGTKIVNVPSGKEYLRFIKTEK